MSNSQLAQYAAIQKLYSTSGNKQESLYLLIWKPLEKYLSGIHTVYYAPTGLLNRIAFQALRQDPTHLLIDNFKQVLSTRSVALPALNQRLLLYGETLIMIVPYPLRNTNSTRAFHLISDTASPSFNLYTLDTKAARSNDDWRTLPGAKKEIDSLKELFQGVGIPYTIDSSAAATEETFKALSGRVYRFCT